MNNKTRHNHNIKYSPLPFWFITAVFSLVAFYLFFNQALPRDVSSVRFPSDTAWHISLAFDVENPSLALIDVLTVKLYYLTGISAEVIMAVLLTLCIFGSVAVLRYFIAYYPQNSICSNQYKTDFIALSHACMCNCFTGIVCHRNSTYMVYI